jgi:peptide chain release factor 3
MNDVQKHRVCSERLRRRTFAIISHPDAGKTTLTEKLLLYSGMVRTAGMVRGRKGSRGATSDWMAMEQERGISITASAMQFPYKDKLINVLDTPGHQDFSEDTYRTLTAADSVIMVIDAGKGVEEQTRKLFKVCRLREIPIITFVNKLDLPTKDRFSLLAEIEDVLGIDTVAFNWPIGSGKQFQGIVTLDKEERDVHFFSRGEGGGAVRVDSEVVALNQAFDHRIPEDVAHVLSEELELIEGAGTSFDRELYLKGVQTPVFFGSALTNFGVELLFDSFIRLAPEPRAYSAYATVEKDQPTSTQITVDPDKTDFSGFVFKIQANMNPKHRDSMAFIRVCSGAFVRDMQVVHHPSHKRIRLSRSYTMKANERDTVDDGYPGDIIGVINPGVFSIGDTVSSQHEQFVYPPMPQFPPEVVGRIRAKDVLKLKSFQKGMQQLCSEGAVQLLKAYKDPEGAPYVAAVGRLQFDVLQHRLLNEYNVYSILDILSYRYSFYLEGDPSTVKLSGGSTLACDAFERIVLLCSNEWEVRYLKEQNPHHHLIEFFG